MDFFDIVAEGVVHGLYKVVTRQCFSVRWPHKVSGGFGTFCHCVKSLHMDIRW